MSRILREAIRTILLEVSFKDANKIMQTAAEKILQEGSMQQSKTVEIVAVTSLTEE